MTNSILFAVDLNHESSWRKALPQAVALARAVGVTLHVVTVIPESPKTPWIWCTSLSMTASSRPANAPGRRKAGTSIPSTVTGPL